MSAHVKLAETLAQWAANEKTGAPQARVRARCRQLAQDLIEHPMPVRLPEDVVELAPASEQRAVRAAIRALDEQCVETLTRAFVAFLVLRNKNWDFKSGCSLTETVDGKTYNCATIVALVGATVGQSSGDCIGVVQTANHIALSVGNALVLSAEDEAWEVRALNTIRETGAPIHEWTGEECYLASTLFNRGLTLLSRNRPDAALPFLEMSVSRNPSPQTWALLAHTLLALGRTGRASNIVTKLVSASSNLVDAETLDDLRTRTGV